MRNNDISKADKELVHKAQQITKEMGEEGNYSFFVDVLKNLMGESTASIHQIVYTLYLESNEPNFNSFIESLSSVNSSLSVTN